MTLIAIVGATGTGKSDLALDLAERVRARGSRRRDRQRRRHAALPRHGHRHGEAPARRAPRHPAPPARRARRHRGGVGRRATSRMPAPRSTTSSRAAASPILVGGSGLYVSSRDLRLPVPGHGCRGPGAARGRARPSAVPGSCTRRLRAIDPDAAAAIGAAERPPHRAGARGHRAHRGADGGAPARRARAVAPAPRRAPAERPRAARRAARRARGGACGATGSSTRCATLVPRGLERGVTARRAIGYAQALAELRGRMPRGGRDRRDRSSSPARTPGGR